MQQSLAKSLIAVAGLTGCVAHSPFEFPPAAIAPERLAVAEVPAEVSADVPPRDSILALDDEMHRFVQANVTPGAPGRQRMRQILRALLDDGGFDIEYDVQTHTAAQTFHARRGNCLAFTNLFVALARDTGLDVAFQEVDLPPDWSEDGESFVLNRHINALVTVGRADRYVVDFDLSVPRNLYPSRVVSDARAASHYYSNVGVERMQAGDHAAARARFAAAIAADPGFASVWVNLGSLNLRAGDAGAAEAAWQHAAALNPREYPALSNLERLYADQQRPALASALRRRIVEYRQQNPYYRFHLAEAAVKRRDWDAAIGHLRFAVGRKPDEDRFLALLGVAYLQRGDARAASRWIARAAEVAATDERRRRYQSKLDLLRKGAT